MTLGDLNTYVLSRDAVRRAIAGLVKIRVHEHFAGYLAILAAVRSAGVNEARAPDISAFHDRYLLAEGDPYFPYVSPFKSRGHGELALINPNVAGSYAPSSLRPGKPLGAAVDVAGSRRSAVYSLREGHALLASRHLLYDNKLPAAALSAFLFRDYGVQLEDRKISLVLDIFRDLFGLRAAPPSEADTFNVLFTNDTADFNDTDLEPR